MKDDNIFIAQQNREDALYTRLQRDTIDRLQQLSGKVWTDFNAHDPGVTIADIANYLLTEVDYKLGFDLLDYLSDEDGVFSPLKYGLYLPEEIYPTTPVRLEDYQKALLSQFPLLKSVSFTCDKDGCYNVSVEPFHSDELSVCNMKNQIHKYFHANRNLCENINEITLNTPPILYLYAEIDVEPGKNATILLAQIYWQIQQYLAGSIHIENGDEQIRSKLSPEQWFEGTNTNNSRVVIPNQENIETELYAKLTNIEGVRAFKTIYLVSLKDEEKTIITNFKQRYTLHIPKSQSDFNIRVCIDNSEVLIDADGFVREMHAIFLSQNSLLLNQPLEKKEKVNLFSLESLPENVYRDVYHHKKMAYDFPNNYGISESGLPLSTPTKDKARANQLKAYLALFDLIISRGLSELKGLTDLLAIVGDKSIETKQAIISEQEWTDIGHDDGSYSKMSNKKKFRNIYDLKNTYLDFLDMLYGVDSCPSWMGEYKSYGSTEESNLNRRVKFLQLVPQLTRNRSRAVDILGGVNSDNLSSIKIYISTLLDMNLDESMPIGNILPIHKLILMDDHTSDIKHRDIVNHKLSEKTLELFKKERIELDQRPQTDDKKYDEYEKLRAALPFFNSHYISGGLFRHGIYLDNYKLIHMNENEYILAFWNKEDSVWMNLLRSNSKEKLIKLANTLRRYLMELNSLCEVVYVVEHNFFYPVANEKKTSEGKRKLDYKFNQPFTITFAFSDWSARLKSERFRDICRQLIQSIMPAHITAHIYWLNVTQMQDFETAYNIWREGLSNSVSQKEMIELQQGIYDVFWEMEREVQQLNIDDNS